MRIYDRFPCMLLFAWRSFLLVFSGLVLRMFGQPFFRLFTQPIPPVKRTRGNRQNSKRKHHDYTGERDCTLPFARAISLTKSAARSMSVPPPKKRSSAYSAIKIPRQITMMGIVTLPQSSIFFSIGIFSSPGIFRNQFSARSSLFISRSSPLTLPNNLLPVSSHPDTAFSAARGLAVFFLSPITTRCRRFLPRNAPIDSPALFFAHAFRMAFRFSSPYRRPARRYSRLPGTSRSGCHRPANSDIRCK